MSRRTRLQTAISALALAGTLSACATSGPRPLTVGDYRNKNVDVGLATRALAALKANDFANAVALAERAVEQNPRDAGFRTLLGNSYFASGRFASAEQAFKDSLSLYENQPQVVLKLALVQIAQGKSGEALAFLDVARPALDVADYGLAIALAGRAEAAVPLLRRAAEGGDDARVRQNLALAYALSGDWTNARVVASQDVPAGQLDERIRQWMEFAAPTSGGQQVAALVGVSPAVQDPGQPVRLALVRDETIRTAAAAPVPAPPPAAEYYAPPKPEIYSPPPVPAYAPPPPAIEPLPPVPEYVASVPAVAPIPAPALSRPAAVEISDRGIGGVTVKLPPARPIAAEVPAFTAAADVDSVPASVVASAPTPAPFAYVEVRRKAPTASPAKLAAVASPAERPRVHKASLGRGGSRAVVQIGAYSNADSVARAWNKASRNYRMLNDYRPMSALYRSGKGNFYRLSVTGFGTTAEARALCRSIQRSGGKCFVRSVAGDRPMEIAAR